MDFEIIKQMDVLCCHIPWEQLEWFW